MEANFYRLFMVAAGIGLVIGACGMGLFLWLR